MKPRNERNTSDGPVTLEEKLSTAMRANSLAVQPDRECAADRIGALGVATFLRDEEGRPRRQEQTGVVLRSLRRELLARLWRLKYGLDAPVRRDCVLELVEVFRRRGNHLRNRRHAPDLLLRFADCLISEWINDHCPACKGRGTKGGYRGGIMFTRAICPTCDGAKYVHEVGQSGYPVQRPCQTCGAKGWVKQGRRLEPVRERVCGECHGLGRRGIDAQALVRPRIDALGITVEEYDASWRSAFADMHHLLNDIDASLGKSLQIGLRRGSIRATE